MDPAITVPLVCHLCLWATTRAVLAVLQWSHPVEQPAVHRILMYYRHNLYQMPLMQRHHSVRFNFSFQSVLILSPRTWKCTVPRCNNCNIAFCLQLPPNIRILVCTAVIRISILTWAVFPPVLQPCRWTRCQTRIRNLVSTVVLQLLILVSVQVPISTHRLYSQLRYSWNEIH